MMASKRPAARKKAASARPARKPTERAEFSAAAAETRSNTAGRARTILYVHGIGNKPPADILKWQWDDALCGFDRRERSRLAYWVNRITYPEPSEGTCKMSDATRGIPQANAGTLAIR